MQSIVERPCTPCKSLEQSLKEMKLMRERKLEKSNWRELWKELEEDESK